eukprot:1803963-Pleurochrysis_carterae.AAC.1
MFSACIWTLCACASRGDKQPGTLHRSVAVKEAAIQTCRVQQNMSRCTLTAKMKIYSLLSNLQCLVNRHLLVEHSTGRVLHAEGFGVPPSSL